MTREEKLKQEYEAKLAALKKEQDECTHNWGEWEMLFCKEYGDLDFDLDFEDGIFLVRKKIDHNTWTRTCIKCGKVEYTEYDPNAVTDHETLYVFDAYYYDDHIVSIVKAKSKYEAIKLLGNAYSIDKYRDITLTEVVFDENNIASIYYGC